MPGRPWSITLGPVSRRGILIIYRAQIWAVSVKFKLRINELFTHHRPRLAPTAKCFRFELIGLMLYRFSTVSEPAR